MKTKFTHKRLASAVVQMPKYLWGGGKGCRLNTIVSSGESLMPPRTLAGM